MAEKLKHKYPEKRKQVPASEDQSGASAVAVQRLISTHRYKRPSKNVNCSSEALNELFKAVDVHPDRYEDRYGNSSALPLQDSQMLFTETDVTLPSCLDASPGSVETERDRMLRRSHHLSDSCDSSSFGMTKVYQEMATIYEQLKSERQSQQQWERVLHEREKRLKQQEEALGRLDGLEQMVHARIVAVEEKHQRELSQLQVVLREKSRENKRLKSSFDTIKELNDNMKTQLNEISEQNKTLESQSKRVQARLENLQRKYEHRRASKDLQKGNLKTAESSKADKKEKAAADAGRRHGEKSNLNPPSPRLLTLLLDWVLDAQMLSSAAGSQMNGVAQCLPPEARLSERCVTVLPLLADQLHHTPSSEPDLLLNLLRLIYGALRHLDNSSQHVALSATLRRIGEEVSKPASQCAVRPSGDPHLPTETSGSLRSWPLYRSPCPHTRLLSTLIILRTITQADVVALALDHLRSDLLCEESRGLFVHYGGVSVLLSLLRANRVGPHTPIDILVQLTQQSRYLNPFLEACSCEEFFKTASQILKNGRLELPSLEKLSILLQKLSSIRKNRHLFELSSLRRQIQELHHKTNPTHTFLCLNLSSILLNLK
ncbi:coiled-coil domain-containing protein 138 [Salarias fasciatus]|uniref:coiled-coil domain-containing protein 138 n=1 Tax=Salarias fasciatus TaxID=181472 RepID=UPI001176FACC|nr:coiled-coil domain-containing protein 138 [Salarias fasciatus]